MFNLPKNAAFDPGSVGAEAYNPHEKTVVLTSIHPMRSRHDLADFCVRIAPRERVLLKHLRYEAAFDDGTPCGPLTLNFGRAIGKGITDPSQYNHADHKA